MASKEVPSASAVRASVEENGMGSEGRRLTLKKVATEFCFGTAISLSRKTAVMDCDLSPASFLFSAIHSSF